MTGTTTEARRADDRREHLEFAAEVAGGPFGSEGHGSRRRYRNAALGTIALLAVALGMLMSYSGAFGRPRLNGLVVAVAADPAVARQLAATDGLDVRAVADEATARTQVQDRSADAAVVVTAAGRTPAVHTIVASGGSRTQVQYATAVGEKVASGLGVHAQVVDVAPLSGDDPAGTVEFYAVVFLGLGASVGATAFGRILGTVSGPRALAERAVVLLVATGLLAGLGTLWVDDVLGALAGHGWALFGALWFYVLAVAVAVTGVAAAGGSMAGGALALVLLVLGNPASGGPYAVHLLPGAFQVLHRILPQGDGLELLRSVQYFDGEGVTGPLVRLGAWLGSGVILTAAAAGVRAPSGAVR